MAFFFGCLFSTFIGRKIGWAVSRNLLYTCGWAVCAFVCFAWAIGLAYGLRLFILAMHPGLLLKIFGYGAGAYISIPNYGLLNESTTPENGATRHLFLKRVPSMLFILASVAFAFTAAIKPPDSAGGQLTSGEVSVLSDVISKREPLTEEDLTSLRQTMKLYNSRTGHRVSRQDIFTLTNLFTVSNDYYYELAQSMLLSWDSRQYQTTRAFDRLYIEMAQNVQRKPAKLVKQEQNTTGR